MSECKDFTMVIVYSKKHVLNIWILRDFWCANRFSAAQSMNINYLVKRKL